MQMSDAKNDQQQYANLNEEEVSRVRSSSADDGITIDDAMERVGNRHNYQVWMTVIFVTQWVLVSFVFMGPTFLLSDPKFECNGVIKTENNGGCEPGCQIVPEERDFMTYQFGLYCEHKGLRSMTISLMYLGVVLGNLIFGALGDVFGRKPVVVGAWFLGSVSVLGMGLSQNYATLLTFTILTGVTLWPPLNTAMIMVNEQCATRFRQVACLIIMLSFGVGESILAGLVYATPHWRACVMYYFFIPTFVMNASCVYLQDSPKFWYQRDPAHALQCLKKIAAANGKSLEALGVDAWRFRAPSSHGGAQNGTGSASADSAHDAATPNESATPAVRVNASSVQSNASEVRPDAHISQIGDATAAGKDAKKYSYVDLFRYRSLRSLTLAMCLLTFCLQVVYFGCQFALSALGLNVYVNTVVAGMSQTVVLVPSMWIIPRIRRKAWLFVFHTVSVLFSFSYLIVDNLVFQTINAGIIKATNRFALSIFTIYVNEVYPTCVRSLGNGINFSVSLVGSVVAPLLVQLGEIIGMNAMFLVACVSLIGIAAYFPFKETLGCALEDEIEELRALPGARRTQDAREKGVSK